MSPFARICSAAVTSVAVIASAASDAGAKEWKELGLTSPPCEGTIAAVTVGRLLANEHNVSSAAPGQGAAA